MSFFSFIHRNKLFMHYATIMIVAVGLFVLTKVQREARPNVSFNSVTITASYPGASPSDVEELVVEPIEERISEVDGIEEYRSTSYTGFGTIFYKN